MKFDQIQYSLMQANWHYQDLQKELRDLSSILTKNNVTIDSAIDVGCGDGKVTQRIGQMLNVKELWGLDLNKKLLDKAQKRGINIFHGEMDKLEKKFDLSICYGSLHHFKDTDFVVSGLKNLSTKYVLIVDSTVRTHLLHKITGSPYFPFDATSYHIRQKEEIINSLEKHGLKLIETHTNKNANIWHDRTIFLAEI